MQIRFVANVNPHGKQRARTVRLKSGITTSYTPKATVAFERAIAWACRQVAKGQQYAQYVPLEMTCWLYMPIPKGLPKVQQERLKGCWHTRKPDGSNIIKSVEDALNGLAYHDDGQIAVSHFYKVYSDCPRVEVIIGQLCSRGYTSNGNEVFLNAGK